MLVHPARGNKSAESCDCPASPDPYERPCATYLGWTVYRHLLFRAGATGLDRGTSVALPVASGDRLRAPATLPKPIAPKSSETPQRRAAAARLPDALIGSAAGQIDTDPRQPARRIPAIAARGAIAKGHPAAAAKAVIRVTGQHPDTGRRPILAYGGQVAGGCVDEALANWYSVPGICDVTVTT